MLLPHAGSCSSPQIRPTPYHNSGTFPTCAYSSVTCLHVPLSSCNALYCLSWDIHLTSSSCFILKILHPSHTARHIMACTFHAACLNTLLTQPSIFSLPLTLIKNASLCICQCQLPKKLTRNQQWHRWSSNRSVPSVAKQKKSSRRLQIAPGGGDTPPTEQSSSVEIG